MKRDDTPVRRALRLATGSHHSDYYRRARELVAAHGDDVYSFLERQFDEIKAKREYDKVEEWFFLCNYVGMILRDGNLTIQ